ETVQCAVVQLPGDYALALAVFAHDQIEREILNEELRFVFDRLTIKRMQDCVTGTVRRGASALHWWAVAELGHVTAKWTLINLAVLRTAERHAIVLKFVNRSRRFTREVFHRVVIAEPVRALDGIVHVP